jgi:carboxymethylenebutenolidase
MAASETGRACGRHLAWVGLQINPVFRYRERSLPNWNQEGRSMDVISSMVSINAGSGKMQSFLARPQGKEKVPAVIVVMEAFGLNDHIKDVTKRIAAEGYAALAPDMYYREKDAVFTYDNLSDAIRVMTSLTDDGIVTDMRAAMDYLKTADFVRADRIGVTGFCMGGRISFLSACRLDGIAAAAPFYGGGIGGLLDQAKNIRAPLLLFFGDQDPFIPNEEVDRIRTRLAELGKVAEVHVYAGAPHGFFCNERDSYRPDAAQDAWRRLKDFLAKHLKG